MIAKAAVLDYMSGPHDGPRCSCRHDGAKWTARCVAATKSDNEEAGKWAADFVRLNPNTQFKTDYLALAAPYLGKVTVKPTMAGPDQYHAVSNEDLR